jgi:hypothetical protein
MSKKQRYGHDRENKDKDKWLAIIKRVGYCCIISEVYRMFSFNPSNRLFLVSTRPHSDGEQFQLPRILIHDE